MFIKEDWKNIMEFPTKSRIIANLQKIQSNYEYNVLNFLHIFIVFIFAIAILLVINSLYNLILITIDSDEYIYKGDYKKYKSIRDLLGYKILMNSYKSGYTSTSEYYNDTYLTLNTNAFLLSLTRYIAITGVIIFGFFTILSYMLPNSNIMADLSKIGNTNFPLILTCGGLLIILMVFNITNKVTIKGYKADRLDVEGTAENYFIKNYLIGYIGITNVQHVKISNMKDAVKEFNKDNDKIFESILNKLKYLDKYNISHELTLTDTNIEKVVASVKSVKDYEGEKIDEVRGYINAAINDIVPLSNPPLKDDATENDKMDKRILLYCYYFTIVNKDNDVDPVKLIYEFIKKVKQIILEKDIDKYKEDIFDIHRNLMGLGEEFEFVYNKIMPTFLVSSYNAKDDNKVMLDDKYENLFIESLYTCDYIGDNKKIVEDINEKMKNAKSQKRDILISIVIIFIIALLLIFIYLNKTDMSRYYYWTYLDNIKKDNGRLSFAYYILNLPKFFKIVKNE
jgi:hypothetical protein